MKEKIQSEDRLITKLSTKPRLLFTADTSFGSESNNCSHCIISVMVLDLLMKLIMFVRQPAKVAALFFQEASSVY